MKKNLYLFRHGQTEWNKLKKIQGTTDIPLTDLGIQQAMKLPNHLKDKNLGVIYSSHLQRAWKTGEIVAEKLEIDIIKNDHLHEVFCGDVQGKTAKEIQSEFGLEFDERWRGYDPKDDHMRFPNGESKVEARERMVNIC